MIRKTYVVTAVICIVVLLTLGAGLLAYGQMTNTNPPPALSPGMEAPLVKDVNLEREVENLAARVNALEATIVRLEKRLDSEINEVNAIKRKIK